MSPLVSRRRPVASAAAVAATGALVLTGCSVADPDAAGGSPAGGDGGDTELVIGVGGEPDSLNPVLGYAPDGASRIFDSLVVRDAGLALQPSLALDVPEPSPDGRTYVVDVRDDVRFHDGEPLDAGDVAFTYSAILDESVASGLAGDFAMLDEVVAVDEDTVEFRLAEPYVPFPQRLTVGIVPEHLLADETDWTAAEFNRAPVGSGPFRFVSWTPGDSMVLEANQDHWDGAPAVSRLTFALTDDDQARAARMAAGELDGAVLPPRLAEQFADAEGPAVQARPSADYRGVMLPQRHPVTGDVDVRRALDLAVDREAMVDGVLVGAGSPAYGPISPYQEEFYDASVERDHDPQAAAALLDGAGWVAGDDGVRAKDRQRAEFTVMYPAGDTVREQLALAFADDARGIGIDVAVDGLSWEAIEPRMSTDALVMGWGTPYDPDFVTYQLFHSSYSEAGFFNPGAYENPAVDAALDAGRTETDPRARRDAYLRLQEEMAADPPWIFLVYLDHVYVVPEGWQGSDVVQVEPHDHGFTAGPWWNVEDWVPAS
ncbi:MAG: ABC transporter substrate-binding protein [Kineosporiaceae bacterium]